MSIEPFEFRIQIDQVEAVLTFSPAPGSHVGAIYGELTIEYRSGDLVLLRDRRSINASNPDDIRRIGHRWAEAGLNRALSAGSELDL